MRKEAARISAAVMSVVVALVTVAGYTLAPEQQEGLALLVTAVVNLALILGVGEWIRKNVYSKATKEAEEEARVAMRARPEDDPTGA